jgi:hypothetical protein
MEAKSAMTTGRAGVDQPELPSEMTVDGRTYEIIGFLKEREECVRSSTMVKRAKEMKAYLGEEDGQHILDRQDEIPAVLQGKVIFVLPHWRHSDSGRRYVACLYWRGNRWCLDWDWLGSDWYDLCRLLRRKAA